MLCCHCKKNQASKTYVRAKGAGGTEKEAYCLDCYHRLFAEEKENYTVCPVCGTTAESFTAKKLVGCAKCYEYLVSVTDPCIVKMQGNGTHCGKQEIKSEYAKLENRAHELQIVYDKLKAEGGATSAGKEYETEIASVRARASVLRKGGAR